MPDLNTKTLNELDTITEMGENDKILVESGGRMKKLSGSVGGGGGVIVEFGTVSQESSQKTIDMTAAEFATLLASGQVPIFYSPSTLSEYEEYDTYMLLSYYRTNGNDFNEIYIGGYNNMYFYAYGQDQIFIEYWD